MSDRLQPALWGGLFIGVLSALPLVNAGNCCCCLWVLMGGALATYLRQQNNPYQIDAAEGAIVGLMAGVVGGIVYSILSIPLQMLAGPMQQEWMNEHPLEQSERHARDAGDGRAADEPARALQLIGIDHLDRRVLDLRHARRPHRRRDLQAEPPAAPAARDDRHHADCPPPPPPPPPAVGRRAHGRLQVFPADPKFPSVKVCSRPAAGDSGPRDGLADGLCSGRSRQPLITAAMYESFYGFREKPFSLTPDPRYFYRSQCHANARRAACSTAAGALHGLTVVTGTERHGQDDDLP